MCIAGQEWAWRDTDPKGTRLPLVFLPGAGGTGDVFYRAAGALKGDRRVMTVRYPALADVDAICSGLSGLLDALGMSLVDIAGSSLGGYIAQAVAIAQPERVRRVLFGNSFYDASWLQAKMSREAVLGTVPADHLARTVAQFGGLPEATPEQADFKSTMLALAGSEQTGEMALASLAAVLGAKPLKVVDLPPADIAILDTEDDPVVDIATKAAMRDRYQASTRYTFETGGHYPSLLNPQAYNDAIKRHFGHE